MPQTPVKPEDPLTQLTAAPSATEHLTHLPKMTPSAGVGVTEYVAINVAAVIALLLGFASILAIMTDALILIPIAAIVTAIISLRQINHSNGTQQGGGIATAGLFLALAIASYIASAYMLEYIGRIPDRQAISHLCKEFGQDLNDGAYDSAYDLFSRHFKSRVSRLEFVDTMKSMEDQLSKGAGAGLGKIVASRWDNLASFNLEPDSGTLTAEANLVLIYQVGSEESLPANFRKSAQIWLIDDIPSMFPAKGKGG